MADEQENSTDDLSVLARQYMDLWQAHLEALANDKETSEIMAKTMALMSSGAQAFAAAGRTDGGGNDDEFGQHGAQHGAAHGAAPVAAADGDPGVERAQLLERLAAVEGRVAELETQLAGIDKRTQPPDQVDDA